jgi:hypothetical protein
MTTTENPNKIEKKNLTLIDNHKTAATHYAAAAKHHTDAVSHIEAGNHEKANESTVKAHGHKVLASEAHKEVSKHHATKDTK